MTAIIEIRYEARSGMFIVENSNRNLGVVGANPQANRFLADHSRFFGKSDAGYWLEPHRVGKFKLYARSKGFEVVNG